MIARLTPEIQEVIDQQHGGPVRFTGAGEGAYVLMSMDVYRDLMGVGSDEDFEASIRAVRQGYEAIRQEKSRPFREAIDELGRKHEVPR